MRTAPPCAGAEAHRLLSAGISRRGDGELPAVELGFLRPSRVGHAGVGPPDDQLDAEERCVPQVQRLAAVARDLGRLGAVDDRHLAGQLVRFAGGQRSEPDPLATQVDEVDGRARRLAVRTEGGIGDHAVVPLPETVEADDDGRTAELQWITVLRHGGEERGRLAVLNLGGEPGLQLQSVMEKDGLGGRLRCRSLLPVGRQAVVGERGRDEGQRSERRYESADDRVQAGKTGHGVPFWWRRRIFDDLPRRSIRPPRVPTY